MIDEEAVSHIWLCNCSTLNFPIYEENLIFFLLFSSYFSLLFISFHSYLLILLFLSLLILLILHVLFFVFLFFFSYIWICLLYYRYAGGQAFFDSLGPKYILVRPSYSFVHISSYSSLLISSYSSRTIFFFFLFLYYRHAY